MDNIDESTYQEMVTKYNNKECSFDDLLKGFSDEELCRYIAERYLENQEPNLVKGSQVWNDRREVIMKDYSNGYTHKYIVGACYKNIEDYENEEAYEHWRLWHPEEMYSSFSIEEDEGYDEFSEEHDK